MKYIKLFENIDPYKNYPEDFKEFLIANDALENFHENLMNEKDWISIKEFIIKNHKDTWISGAFDWGDTPQGHKYWDDLDDWWYKFNI